jgi:exodeoxyribonuclease VII large subunit
MKTSRPPSGDQLTHSWATSPLGDVPLPQEPTLGGESRDVYTVTRLNQEARDLLELTFPYLWVEGEVSNLSRPPSGHLYFTLKDSASQVRCAMFRNQNRLLRAPPRDGQRILVRAHPSLYTARGDFQLLVEFLEDYGAGELRRAFEQLKQRLLAEGLFDPARKRPLPAFPRRIGVITSPTGAAVRDILHVLGRRFPSIPVLIYPVPVQGAEAASRITQAIGLAGERAECDVLILARGGGSLEDLQAFNEEVVARALAACPIPVVTGIGHEIDFTIADFAADLRAPTPSAAAELVSPDREDWARRLAQLGHRLGRALGRRVARERERLGWLVRRLPPPRRRIQEYTQRVDQLGLRLAGVTRAGLARRRSVLAQIGARLERQSPRARLAALRARERQALQRLMLAWRRVAERRRAQVAGLARALEAVSPVATLRRGYAILAREEDGAIVRSVGQVATGEGVRARVVDGELHCRVEGGDPAPRGIAEGS